MGTFGGALEARHVDAADGKLIAEVRGEVEDEDGVLVLKRIHVHYRLRAPEERRAVIERVHRSHHRSCPIYRSIHEAVEISTEVSIVEG